MLMWRSFLLDVNDDWEENDKFYGFKTKSSGIGSHQ